LDFIFQATAEANNLAALASSKDAYTKRMELVSFQIKNGMKIHLSADRTGVIANCEDVTFRCFIVVA